MPDITAQTQHAKPYHFSTKTPHPKNIMNYKTLTPAQRAALPESVSTYTRHGDQGDTLSNYRPEITDHAAAVTYFKEIAHHGAENYISSASWRLPEILKSSNRMNKNAAAAVVIWNAIGYTQAEGLKMWKKWNDDQKEEIAGIVDDYLNSELENLLTNF